MKNTVMKYAIIVLLITILAPVLSCDTKSSQHPYLIINVNKKTGNVVDATRKLYAVFYLKSDWSSKLFTISSASNTLVTPFELDLKDYPVYFEVVYDDNGSGTIDTGDIFQGWNRKTDRTKSLSALIIPDIPVMILNLDLDSGTGLMP